MADVRARDARISIPWRDWTPEAFRQAQELGRPILLSIGAVWCHWCHVMDRSTFSDPEVIRRVSEELVPIRVDNDRRPDINSRYNLGGWPTNALLSPEGDMLTGGTYLPPEELLSLIDEVQTYYRERRDELEERIATRRVRRARIAELRAKLRAPMGPEVVDSVAEAIRQAYDPQYGGFGKAPKFPMPDVLDFALAVGYLRRESAFTDIAADTLTAMAEGGIHDAEGGGFFRYATRADWGAPHYEKMLEGNVRLLSVYLHAARLLDRPLYWAAARGIVAWLTQTALLENGCFAGSQDADEEYYHLPASTRSRRVAPRLDETVFAGWNGMAASALFEAAASLGQPDLGQAALEALETAWRLTYMPRQGVAHYYDGRPHLPGFLADQVWVAHALLDAQAYVGHGDYVARARQLFDVIDAHLLDTECGGYFDFPADPQAFGNLKERRRQLEENAAAADLALRLHRLTGVPLYLERATRTLEAMAPLYRAYRHHGACYAQAVQRFVYAPLHLVVVGDPRAQSVHDLRLAALALYDPNREVETVDPSAAPERLRALDLPAHPAPAFYARRGERLKGPVTDPGLVRATVEGV
ncbi:MAG: thioredoxin domain-containing protein [Anaerolineae bacterium]